MQEKGQIAEGGERDTIEKQDSLEVTIQNIKDTIVMILKDFSRDLIELQQAREEAEKIMKDDPSRSPYVGVRRLNDHIYYINQGRINRIEGLLNEALGLQENGDIRVFRKKIETLLNILKNHTVLGINFSEDETINVKYQTDESFKL